MLYGSEFRAIDWIIEQSMSIAEIIMLRRTSGVTIEDRTRSEYERGNNGIISILEWDGLGMWWDERKQKQ